MRSILTSTPLRGALFALSTSLVCASADAQWNPPAAQWGKVDPADLRVETYNVKDAICSTNAKVEGANNWCALARIIAALKPDVLILQECADNSGNGTGSNVDTVAQLTTTIGNFLHGGVDTFHGSTPVTAFVQKYAPSYDLPYVFVANNTDGFNRNVILSRFPFADLNGDGVASYSNIPAVNPDQWAPGGDGGIRGFQFVEIALPHATYTGNLVIGGAHLKSGSTANDHTERIVAAENVSYFIQYWYNANGGTLPDPNNKINDAPPATNVLAANTPIIIAGDWNEDELTDGTKGPAEWLTHALATGACCDGTDRDGSDMTYDASIEFFSGSRATEGSAKFDYIAWQDSITTLRMSNVFYTNSMPVSAIPPEILGLPTAQNASSTASDHRTVFADLLLPIVDCNANGVADTTDIANGTSQDVNGDSIPDECEQVGPGLAFCIPGTGNVMPCPCSNAGAPGRGCDNSSSTGGASLSASGVASLAADTLQFTSSGEKPTALSILLQGHLPALASGTQFGQGVLCFNSTLKRLYVHSAAAGVVTYPQGVDPSVSAESAAKGDTITAGATRLYASYYRDPTVLGACAAADTFNVSQGQSVPWGP